MIMCCGRPRETAFCADCGKPLLSLPSGSVPLPDAFLAVYMRVSTMAQDMEVQKPGLDKWASGQTGEVKWYQDKYTGLTMNRPGFDDLLAEVRKGKVKQITVWKLDRLGRNVAGMFHLLEELNHYGVKLVSLCEGIDFSTPMGKAMFQFLAIFAEMEANFRAMRVNERYRLVREQKDAGDPVATALWHKWFGGRVRKRPEKLTKDEKRVINLRFQQYNTVQQIAAKTGLPDSAINRILKAAMERRHKKNRSDSE